MKIYLVGGAVRDGLLGLTPREKDWVVVGGEGDTLVRLGYRQVGKDFPVFLHPETGEEYALARQERKVAPGYAGFEFSTHADVSLEEDLKRRDLTINAMALDDDGQLVDPFQGQRDLKARTLRHVSEAFVEDPVRILRVARFMARFKPLGFSIAEETMALMAQIVALGEVDALVPERIFAELNKALAEPAPSAFFETLQECGALKRLFPEIDALFGVPQSIPYHPEVDTGLHTLMVLDQAARLSPDPKVRFAALLHDLGKGETNPTKWPRHPGHEARGLSLVQILSRRIRAPMPYQRLAERVARYHGHAHRALNLSPGANVDLLQRLDAIRQPEAFKDFLLAVEADARGRPGYEDEPYPQGDWLRCVLATIQATNLSDITRSGLTGKDLGRAIRVARIRAVASARSTF